jgi:hypothetical protein
MIILKYQYPITEEKLVAAAQRTGYTGELSDLEAVTAHVTELFKGHTAPWVVRLLDPNNLNTELIKLVSDSITGTYEQL